MDKPTPPPLQWGCDHCGMRWSADAERTCKCTTLSQLSIPGSILILFLLLVSLLTGCIKSPVDDQVVAKQVGYFQDKRTGLCFAYMKDTMGGFTMVPCNQVKPLLDNDWSH
jgi:hypothetical protein